MRNENVPIQMNAVVGPLTLGSVKAIRKRFISSFTHKHPCVIFKFTLDDFPIEVLELFCVLDLSVRSIKLAHIQKSDFLTEQTVNQKSK